MGDLHGQVADRTGRGPWLGRTTETSPRPQPGLDTSDFPESAAVNVRRPYTFAASVTVDSADSHVVLFAQGGVGGHTLLVKDDLLHHVYSWHGERQPDMPRRPAVPLPGGTIDHVVVEVSGESEVDYDRETRSGSAPRLTQAPGVPYGSLTTIAG